MRISIILLFLCTSTFAKAQKALIDISKNNMLFIGIENYLDVKTIGVKENDLVITFSKGCSSSKVSPLGYVVIPDGTERLISIKIGTKGKNVVKYFDSVEFRVRNLPKPESFFGSKQHGKISKSDLKSISMINVHLGEGFTHEGFRFIVTKYSVKIISSGQIFNKTIEGNKITESLKTKFHELKAEDMIIINEIEATFNDKVYKLNPIVLTVKN